MGIVIAYPIALFVGAIVLVSWRRPDQIANPSLWFEEGTQLLVNYAQCGWCALWRPVNGSIILSSKLILLPALKLSILHAGRLAAAGATVFIALVVTLIGTAPTHLKARHLCAIAALLIPTSAENYGVALYTFWWAGLLIALALLWNSARGLQWLRLSLLVLGGLSSPIMFPLSALFVVRAWFERTRSEVTTAALAVALGAISGATMLASNLNPIPPQTLATLLETVGKFVGLFIVPGVAWPVAAGIASLLLLAWLLLKCRRRLDMHFLLLSASVALVVACALARAPIGVIGPFEMGARYFFYPYIFATWLLLWIAWALLPSPVAFVPVAMIVASVLGGLRTPLVTHPHLDHPRWSVVMQDCAAGRDANLKIALAWEVYDMTTADCRTLVANSIIKN